MRQFKLIKEYPGGPPLGTIAEENGGLYFEYDLPQKKDSFLKFSVNLHRTLVLEFPEYWEEVTLPLFYTMDGEKAIYKGDKYYAMGAKLDVVVPIINANESFNPIYAFSTREAAECYRFQNAKCISFNDVMDIFPNMRSQKKGILSATVNEKLNYDG